MVGKIFVITQDLGSLLREGMVVHVHKETDKEFFVEILNAHEDMFITTFKVAKALRKFFHEIS